MHVPSQPLNDHRFRGFQTPADTSQCSRFFRVWRLCRVAPAWPIPQRTSERPPVGGHPFSAVDGRKQLWLCPDRRLLRGSQLPVACTVTTLERSLLSRFRTPADTSQCSRFFRVWRPAGSPRTGRSLSLLRSGYVFVAVLFCRRRKPLYCAMKKCQRPRFVQLPLIFCVRNF
jgi:hypothetical protein